MNNANTLVRVPMEWSFVGSAQHHISTPMNGTIGEIQAASICKSRNSYALMYAICKDIVSLNKWEKMMTFLFE